MNAPANILTPVAGALQFAAHGFPVFPCEKGGKPPLVKFKVAATTDAEQIKAWAQEYEGCNFAAEPARADCLVFDLDVKNGKNGVAELERLEKEHGFAIDRTLIVRTPSGGFHIWLKGTAPPSVDSVAVGIDVRSVASYVLLPGSVVNGDTYSYSGDLDFSWEQIAESPPALLALANAKKRERKKAPSALSGVPFTPAQLTKMLSFLDPDCPRDEWRDIAAALHAAPCTDPNFDKRDLFVRWSRGEVRK